MTRTGRFAAIAFGFLAAFSALSLGFGLTRFSNVPPPPSITAPAPPTLIKPQPPLGPVVPLSGFISNVVEAVNPLYVKFEDGSIHFDCTTTVFQKTGTGYLALTAKHCVAQFSDFFIMVDPKSDAPYLRAELLTTGDDIDVAILSFNTTADLPVIPLGDERFNNLGDEVVNVAMPMNLGKLLFHGYIAEMVLSDAITDPMHRGNMGLQLPAAGGSSGSAVIDPKQEAIIGVLVAIYVPRNGGVILTTCVPVSKVREVLMDYTTGRKHPTSKVNDWLSHIFGGR